jgi:hypothetical protein
MVMSVLLSLIYAASGRRGLRLRKADLWPLRGTFKRGLQQPNCQAADAVAAL